MKNSHAAGRPFFAYVPFSLIHFPTLAHPEFAGRTGGGDIADAMAEMDRNVGVILDALGALGIETRHDRDLGQRRRGRGSAPLARHRWPLARLLPDRPRRRHSHAFPDALARPHSRWLRVQRDRPRRRRAPDPRRRGRLRGALRPRDRWRQPAPVSRRRQAHSNREGFIYFAPPGEVRAIKWRDWKLHYVFQEEPRGPIDREMRLFNLRSDPKEETDVKDFNPGVLAVVDNLVREFWKSVERYPLIPVGAPDPYVPTPPSR